MQMPKHKQAGTPAGHENQITSRATDPSSRALRGGETRKLERGEDPQIK